LLTSTRRPLGCSDLALRVPLPRAALLLSVDLLQRVELEVELGLVRVRVGVGVGVRVRVRVGARVGVQLRVRVKVLGSGLAKG